MVTKLTITAVLLTILVVPLGCSTVSQFPASLPAAQAPAIPTPLHSPHTNLDELENDASFLSDIDPSLRAVELSRLWFDHAMKLERSSYTGTFAALSRSAHTALEHLLGHACQTPFHPPCRDLDQAYKRALEALARLLARHSWNPPDLERTRYHLTHESIQALAALREWRISFDQATHEQLAMRPGLGLASVGCRSIRGADTVCSPLTFVMTFSNPLNAAESEVSFNAFDAFQQEIVTIGNGHIPLAAAFTQAALTLGALASNQPKAALYCLSMPTSNTSTTVVLVEQTEAAAAARNLIIPLLRDPEITNGTSLCLQSIGAPGGITASARSVTESLRSAHSPVRSDGLIPSTRQPLTIIAIGDRAAETAGALVNRTGRARRAHTGKNRREIQFMPQGLVVIHTGEPPASIAAVTDLPTTNYQAPCSHECIRGLKEAIMNAPVSSPQTGPNAAQPSPEQDDSPLSPVM
jgi:hypothetical protein